MISQVLSLVRQHSMLAIVAAVSAAMILVVASPRTSNAQQAPFDPLPAGPGVHIAVYQGASFHEATRGIPNALSFWVAVDGALVGYIPGAPSFVNDPFESRFAGDVPSGTPMLIVISAAGPSATPPNAAPTPAEPRPPSASPSPTAPVIPTPALVPTQVPPQAPAGLTVFDIDGRAYLLAADSTYLGVVSSNQFGIDSICNEFGSYGSPYGLDSVRNEFGTYGSPYQTNSAYNPYSFSPPAIVLDGYIIGYLTKNEFHPGAVDPDVLFALYGCVY